MDINALRKSRNTDFSKISGEFQKIANPQSESKSFADDRFWKLEADKVGNGSATLRFLPTTEGDELPWVRIFSHGFQGPTGKWYIENSLTTLGENDPVGELNSKLWASSTDDNSPGRKQARAQKRRLSFIANVLIVDDPKHPENNGQVKLFKFGKKIFDKIMDKARPTFEDEKPVNVFDFWDGANFKLRQRKVEGYTNYDQSSFLEPQALSDDEDKILSVANAQHKLSEFTDRKNFKTYEELSRKLADVLDGNGGGVSAAEMEEAPVMEAPKVAAKPAPAPTATKAKNIPEINDDEDDVMSYFQSIADED
jgi:hypothetical protein